MIWKVIDRETVASLAASVGCTASKVTPSVEWALVQAIGGDVRMTFGGATAAAPVAATTGHRLVEDGIAKLYGHQEMLNSRFIDDGGTAKLEVTYYGR